MHLKMIAFVIL